MLPSTHQIHPFCTLTFYLTLSSHLLLEMRVDHTTPVSYYSKVFSVSIDWDYWKNKDPLFPEDALIWFTDSSRATLGTGFGIFGLRPNKVFASLWVNLPRFFKLKYTPFYNVHVKI